MTAASANRPVDHSATRVNQPFIHGLLMLAFVPGSSLDSDACAPCVMQGRYSQQLQAEFGARIAVEKADADGE